MNKLSNIGLKTAKGAGLILSANILNRFLGTIFTIILARLLVPEMFGILALANVTINMLNFFNEMGISSALIYRDERLSDATDTAFTFQLFLSVILYSIIFVSAPLIAKYYSNPEFISILRWLGISIIINSFGYTQSAQLNKQLLFEKLFWVDAAPVLVKGLISITLALLNCGVWSLVFGILSWQLTKSVLLILFSPRKIVLKLDVKILKDLLPYGLNLFAAGIVIFVYNNGDNFVIGKFIGVSELGFYTMAYSLSCIVINQISNVISNASFPAYTKLNQNIDSLRQAYLKVLRHITVVIFPLAVLIFFIGDKIIPLLLGVKWIPAIPCLKILAVMGVVRAIGSTAGAIYKAIGKPRIIFWCAIIQLIAAIIAVYFLIYLGIEGVALGMTISIFFGVLYSLYRLKAELNLTYKIFFRAIQPAIISCVAMLGIGIIFDSIFKAEFNQPIYILILVSFMVGINIGALYIFSYQTFQEIKHTLISVISKPN
jgi:PST family polysaccharide transporter